MTRYQHRRKTTSGSSWQASDLLDGEIGVNCADGTLHIKRANGTIANGTIANFSATIPDMWVRPAWPELVMPGTSEQRVRALVAVFPGGVLNRVGIQVAGNYTVDWGDGTTTNHNGNAVAQRDYDYDSLSAPVFAGLYKVATVNITPQAGNNLTSLNWQARPTGINSAYPAPWLDVAINGPNINSILFGGYNVHNSMIERIRIGTIGTITNGNDMFRNLARLQSLNTFNTANMTSAFNMLEDCVSARSWPFLNTGNCLDFAALCRNNYSLIEGVSWDLSNGRNNEAIYRDCYALQIAPAHNMPAATNLYGFHLNNRALSLCPAHVIPAATQLGDFAQGCSFRRVRLTNQTRGINLATMQLNRAAIVEYFGLLGTASGSQTITLTGNPGVAALTGADIAIATGKGWTIAT